MGTILSNTRERVSSDFQTPEIVFLMKLEMFWKSDETLSRVFDISSHPKQKT